MARSAMAGFVAGAMWLQTEASLPPQPAAMLAGVLLLSMLLTWLLRQFAHNGGAACRARHIAYFSSGLACGFLWSAQLASIALTEQLAREDEGRDMTVTGIVVSLPSRTGQGVRFNFATEHAAGQASSLPRLIALSWAAGDRDRHSRVPEVQPGERWRLTVRLQRPHGNANPYGFDYELWLLEQGVRATGYVREATGNRRLDTFVPSLGNVVERSRAALRARIQHALPQGKFAGVIVALVIGDQRAISQADWEVFNRTGVSHLVSISGLHITLLAGLAAWGAAALWRRSLFTSMQLPLLLPVQKVAALAGLLTALAYVLLAGWGVPAQRTLYMLAVVAVALWSGRIAGMAHVLCLAACVTVLLDPWAVLWPGFWLSFGAVAAILYATAGRPGGRTRYGVAGAAGVALPWRARAVASLRMAVRVQYAVTVGLVPLTMLLFAQFSLASPLANAIAIPVVSLLVTPLALAGSVLPAALGTPMLQLAHAAFWLLAQALQWLSAWPPAVWSAPVPPAWAFAWALLGAAWMLAPGGWPVRWLGAVTWLPLLLAQPDCPPPGRFRVTAFDVGQGMAVLVETAGHRLLYDTGPAYSPESNGGNRVILPYLKARGVRHLDGVIVSHSDSDHAGGALAVLQGIDVAWLASSWPERQPLSKGARWRVPCMAGQVWHWDGVDFEFLHPQADSYLQSGLKPNARSCVLKISAAGKAALLAGDIEAAQEAQLVANRGHGLHADVLLAPHHGSGTSSTAPFLRAVDPSLALFQVGYRNRFHHPQPQVWARYQAQGIESLRTDQLGAVTVTLGPVVTYDAYRTAHARYWHGK